MKEQCVICNTQLKDKIRVKIKGERLLCVDCCEEIEKSINRDLHGERLEEYPKVRKMEINEFVKVIPKVGKIKIKDKKVLNIKDGLNLVVGRNGSGKTRLLKAIEETQKQKLSFDSFCRTLSVGEKIMISLGGLAAVQRPTCFLIDNIGDQLAPENIIKLAKMFKNSGNQAIITLHSFNEPVPPNFINIINLE